METQYNLSQNKIMPREKLNLSGAGSLSDTELLAVLLGRGQKGKNVFQLANELLPIIDSNFGSLSLERLSELKGIGPAKAMQILSALEFSRRRFAISGKKIKNSSDVLPLVSHLSDRKQEHFICISLNGAHEVIASRIVTVGLVNLCQVHPREVLADPLTDRATAILIAHNHPSGNLEPSAEDHRVTNSLKQASELLGLRLLDHIIFSTRGHKSFREEGWL